MNSNPSMNSMVMITGLLYPSLSLKGTERKFLNEIFQYLARYTTWGKSLSCREGIDSPTDATYHKWQGLGISKYFLLGWSDGCRNIIVMCITFISPFRKFCSHLSEKKIEPLSLLVNDLSRFK